MGKHSIETVIKKANFIHKNRYDYSLVKYVNTDTKIIILCDKHGVFKQTPHHHLRGSGCPECKNVKPLTTDIFIIKANEIHNNKYDYLQVSYINSSTTIKIICKKHGIFEQRPNDHLGGSGCRKCLTCDIEDFIRLSNELNNNKYDYSLVNYRIGTDKVKIICKKHGVFEQTVHGHLQGNGCSKCVESKGECEIETYLIENNINFIKQKRFSDCRDIKPLPFDFYLPDDNVCVEYDGEQHFKPVNHWGGEIGLKKTMKRDKIKTEYCIKNNIPLIRITYKDELLISLKRKLNGSAMRNY